MTSSVLVTDTSAWVAILRAEPEAASFVNIIGDASSVLIAAPTKLECYIVAFRNQTLAAAEQMMSLLAAARVQTVAFDDLLLTTAIAAYGRYGRGNGIGGSLNFGDCFSYALAKTRGLPLLFKGDDFRATDVEAAV